MTPDHPAEADPVRIDYAKLTRRSISINLYHWIHLDTSANLHPSQEVIQSFELNFTFIIILEMSNKEWILKLASMGSWPSTQKSNSLSKLNLI